ncbi:putative ribonuclease H-like domain-containing protein [Tanacetum coccineum]|uniref:Ribonuclease H-like domain-containing protein n=1 Tax=Tanacetum coccineum TaxID=301880 RepID=A0ABQ5BFG4_9ASTR
MLADSKLPTTFWAEAVNTACYVQNRVLVVKPHNKTPYELFRGRTPALSFMRPFSKAFRVYNIRTRKVEENLHIRFLEDKPIIAGDGPKWLFDIDVLTKSMNYVPVVAGTNSNDFVGTEESIVAGHSSKETGSSQDYILMPLWKDGLLLDSSSKSASNDEPRPPSDARKKDDEYVYMYYLGDNDTLEATHADFFGDETEVNMSNITTTYLVNSTSNTRIHKDHSLYHVIGDVQSVVQTRRMTNTTNEQGFINAVYVGKTHEDLHTCLFACFLSQEEPKRIVKALSDSAWVEAMQEELLYKKDERGIVIRNKARLVAQGYTQEEGIDYDEVFAPVARIEAIGLFLAYASFMGFMVYQMDVKSVFLYGRIEDEVYVCQPLGFEDPNYPGQVYKVVKALYGLHQAPRAWYETLAKYLLDNGFHKGNIDQTLFIKKQKGDILLVQVYVDDIIFGSSKKELYTEFEKLMHDKFQMSSIRELTLFLGLQVTQKKDGIFISQDKYVADILRKFSFTDVKTASTPIDTEKPLLKDSDGDDVDIHLYRSMIGSLMYLTSSRPDIMFAVCACARFQVTPKVSHLHAVKGFLAYSDSDYAGASLDKKSTT